MYILAGGSGIPNFGDELIALNWIRFIQSRDPGAEILLDCKDPQASEAVLGAIPNVSHVSVLRRLSRAEKELDFWGHVRRGREFIRAGGFRRNPFAASFAQAAARARVFHIFGGGYINERWPSTGFLLGFAASLQELHGVRVATTGLGLMPLSPPPNWRALREFNDILARFEVVDVRDAESWEAIAGAPGTRASNGLDDSFLAPVAGRAGPGPRTLHVAVSFGDGNAERFAGLVNHTSAVLRPMFDRALFWRCAPGKDEIALRAFRAACPDIEVREVRELVHGPLPIGPDDAMVATRFHPHLMAARLGIPGYYVVGNEYYRVKHGSVARLGSGFAPFPREPAGFAPASGDMPERDAERVAAKRAIAETIYRRVGGGREAGQPAGAREEPALAG